MLPKPESKHNCNSLQLAYAGVGCHWEQRANVIRTKGEAEPTNYRTKRGNEDTT